MSITQISAYRATWTETSITVSGGTPLAGSMFQTLLTNLQQLRENGEKQLRGWDLSQLAEGGETETKPSDSLFVYWADLEITDQRFFTGDGYQASSRFGTMMEDYEEWKRRQADSTLPVSQGSEEGDLAWLREKFSGNLSAFEVIDAIESLYAMGRIDRAERNDIYGLKSVMIRTTDLNWMTKVVWHGEDYDPFRADGFERAPLMGFYTLDDILEWLKSYRAQPLSVREIQWRAAAIETSVICQLAAEEGLSIERADMTCAEEAC